MNSKHTSLKYGFIALTVSATLWMGQRSTAQEVTTVTTDDPDAAASSVKRTNAWFPHWLPANRGLADADVRSLAVDAVWPTLAYATTADGLYRTASAGAVWRRVPAVPGGSGLEVVSDPKRFGVAYAGGVQADGHLYQTFDGGLTWTTNAALDAREPGPERFPYARPLAVALTDSRVLYAVVDGVRQLDLATSADAGASWRIEPAPGERGTCCLTVLAPSARHAYLTTLESAPSLYETTDAGTTWTRLTLELSFIESLAADPRNPKILYAAGLKSDASGPVGTVLRKSTDAGATWFSPSTELDALLVDRVAVSRVDGRVYITVRASADAQNSSVLVSRDRAVTFEEASRGLPQTRVRAVVPMPALPCGAYAATAGAGVYKTYSSGGQCW